MRIDGEQMIAVNDLKKYFPLQKGFMDNLFAREKGFVRAVDGVSFSIKKGEVLGSTLKLTQIGYCFRSPPMYSRSILRRFLF